MQTVILKSTPTAFIGNIEDAKRGRVDNPVAPKVLRLPFNVFKMAVAVAESQGFQAPRGDYHKGQAQALAQLLQLALDGKATRKKPVALRAGRGVGDMVEAFLTDAANRKQCERLVAFIGKAEGGLEVAVE